MKKIIVILLCACLVLCMAACGTKKSTVSETYNGITQTVTVTTTSDGKETTEVTYTGADGKAMDAESGAAAFEAAKAEVLGVVSEAEEDDGEDAENVEASAEASTKKAGAKTVSKSASDSTEAVLTFVNDIDEDISTLNISYAEDTTWGDNLLEEYDGLEAGYQIKFGQHIFYTDADQFDLRVITASGEELVFNTFDLAGIDDPENVTLTVAFKDDGSYTLRIK